MKKTIIAGIDIGTHTVKVAIAQRGDRSDDAPKIIGIGMSETRGLRHGYIVNMPEAVESIRKAVEEAERATGITIKEAVVGVGGIGLGSCAAQCAVNITRNDGEVTELDLRSLSEECKRTLPPAIALNYKIIHEFALSYRLDSHAVFGNPLELRGQRLEGRRMFITCQTKHYNDIISAVENADVDVIGVYASPIAAGHISLTKPQKVAGCVLANIGSETVSIVVYENGLPISLEVFPIGSNDITNDIALGLKVSLEEAEQIKLGKVQPQQPKKKVDEIVMARLSDIFELIQSHLKKIGRGLLPAGVILTGGGSGVTTIEDLARAYLDLPSKVIKENLPKGKVQIRDSTWSVVYGLCALGLSNNLEEAGNVESVKGSNSGWGRSVGDFFKQLIP